MLETNIRGYGSIWVQPKEVNIRGRVSQTEKEGIKIKGVVTELVTAMSRRMSSAELQEGLPLRTVHAKAESTRTYLLVAVFHWSNFTPWGTLSLPFGFQIYGCWESSGASCIFVSTGTWRGREEVAGVGIRWVLSGVVHGWYEGRGAAQHRTCLWFELAAVTGSRIKALSQGLVRDSTARTQAKCMYPERHVDECHFSSLEVFTSYYYYQVTE